MKNYKTILIATIIASAFFLMSFSPSRNAKEESLNCKEIEKSVVKINDKLYAGKYEVSNVEYRNYLHLLIIQNKTDLLKKAHIDTLNWLEKPMRNEPYVLLYFRHPAYANYPLVNVSYEAAKSYCEWLTTNYNSSAKRKFKKVIFRLPTEAEWELAARGGKSNTNYPWGNYLVEKNQFRCNYRHIGDENLRFDTITKKIIIEYSENYGIAGNLSDRADLTAPVNAYYANDFGLYNVCGNVAEMTQEKGILKGGSWKNPGGDVKISSKSHYSKSATDIGFRYFMEIIES